MSEPVKLNEDPTVPEDIRDHVQRAANVMPVAFDMQSELASFQKAAAARPPLWKLFVPAGVVVVAVVALFIAWPRTPAPHDDVKTTLPTVATTVETPSPIVSAPPITQEPLPSASAPTSAPKPPAPHSALAPSLQEEIDHLARLRNVSQSDPGAAIKLAEEGHRRFGHGALYAERESILIAALAKQGRTTEARTRADAFLGEFPRGPAAEKVRAVTQQ